MTREFDEALQVCLDLIRGGHETIDTAVARYPEFADFLKPQLVAALWITSHRDILEPRPGFVPASRRRLVERIKQEQAPQVQPTWRDRLPVLWRQFWTVQKVAPVAFVFVLMVSLIASGTVVTASRRSLPGDDLYAIKRTMEHFALATSFDQANDAQLHIAMVKQRLNEVQGLITTGRYDEVAKTVSEYEEQVDLTIETIGEVATVDFFAAMRLAAELQNILDEQVNTLNILQAFVPEDIQPAIDKVITVSEEAENRADRFDIGLPPATPTATKPVPTRTQVPPSTPTPAPPEEEEEPTSTAVPPTNTPRPTDTEVPPTDTPVPTPTNTPVPTPTNTPVPTSTDTPVPTSTDTPVPTPTDTPVPTPTNTPVPTSTDTPVPTPTNTPVPTPTLIPDTPTNVPAGTDETPLGPTGTPNPAS